MNTEQTKQAKQAIDASIELVEAELSKIYSPHTISLAHAGLGAMLQTIVINCNLYDGKEEGGLDPGRVLAVIIEIMKTIDIGSDHLSNTVHKRN